MTRIIDLLFTQECLDKLEELFYTSFYCTTYIGYENVLSELSKTFISTGDNGYYFKNISLHEVTDMYLLVAERTYTIHDDVMNDIIFNSVLNLFVDIIIIPRCLLFENKLKILNRRFILPITGNINIMNFIQNNSDKINHIYGKDIYKEYGWNQCIKYMKEELTEYFKFNSQKSILK